MDQQNPEPGEPNPYASPPGARPPYGPEPPQLIENDKDVRMMGMFCHLAGLSSMIGIPGFVGPLVIWLIKKDEMPFVDDQGKESLNFQITMMIATLVFFVVTLPLICGMGVFLPLIANVVFCIIGTVQANKGEYYRYPINIRMIT